MDIKICNASVTDVGPNYIFIDDIVTSIHTYTRLCIKIVCTFVLSVLREKNFYQSTDSSITVIDAFFQTIYQATVRDPHVARFWNANVTDAIHKLSELSRSNCTLNITRTNNIHVPARYWYSCGCCSVAGRWKRELEKYGRTKIVIHSVSRKVNKMWAWASSPDAEPCSRHRTGGEENVIVIIIFFLNRSNLSTGLRLLYTRRKTLFFDRKPNCPMTYPRRTQLSNVDKNHKKIVVVPRTVRENRESPETRDRKSTAATGRSSSGGIDAIGVDHRKDE